MLFERMNADDAEDNDESSIKIHLSLLWLAC